MRTLGQTLNYLSNSIKPNIVDDDIYQTQDFASDQATVELLNLLKEIEHNESIRPS